MKILSKNVTPTDHKKERVQSSMHDAARVLKPVAIQMSLSAGEKLGLVEREGKRCNKSKIVDKFGDD